MSLVRSFTTWKMPALSLALLSLSLAAFAQTSTVHVAIDASKTSAPISKNIYGQFLEHGGDIVNTGVWAELLADRKFYYPVSAAAPVPPPMMGNGAGNPRFRRPITRWWAPIGGDDAVTMDTKAPYTGDQTPQVTLDAKTPHGVAESGIVVRKGKAYVGRIVLAGAPGSQVKVVLVWGKDTADRQTVALTGLTPAYRKFPFKFLAHSDTDDARIEITATGAGSLHIGAVSLMPADNIEGFRAEVIAALKQLHSGVYRFPGGNFVSSYEWRYGVGLRFFFPRMKAFGFSLRTCSASGSSISWVMPVAVAAVVGTFIAASIAVAIAAAIIAGIAVAVAAAIIAGIAIAVGRD